MTLKNYLTISIKSLTAHKGRSMLTILGIVIGIAAIILITSLGKGAQNLILGELQGMGAETIIIRPGREPRGPSDLGHTLFENSLKERDVEALKRKSNVPDLIDVAPVLIIPGSVAYQGETYRPTIFGWSSEFMARAFNIQPERGRLFNETDIRQKANMAVIGAKVAEELFGTEDPIGKIISIRNKKMQVIGVFPSRGQVAFFNVNEVMVVPYTTAQTYLLGVDYYHEIVTRAATTDAVARTVDDIKQTLREIHNITDPSKDDFFVVTQEGAVKQIGTIISTLTLFLSLVVAIALVVGGIGVMNIMLVSVTERTREIGLRKALGATEKNILIQFLLEAMLLTAAGGIFGVLMGSAFAFLATTILEKTVGGAWSFAFPYDAALIGIAVSAGVGLIFGLYPAKKAAKKDPIEALRYE